MKTGASAIRHRFGHKRQQQPLFQRDLTRHGAHQKCIITGFQGVVEPHRQLKLAVVKLAIHAFKRNISGIGGLPDVIHDALRVTFGTCVINEGSGGIIGTPDTILIPLKNEGFGLKAEGQKVLRQPVSRQGRFRSQPASLCAALCPVPAPYRGRR